MGRDIQLPCVTPASSRVSPGLCHGRRGLWYLLVLVVVGLASPEGRAELYRYVDEHGKVIYTDRLPPQQAGGARTELDASGRPVDEVDAVQRQSAEEKARLERERAEAEAERQRLAQQAEEDRRLIALYPDEATILAQRDQQIAVIRGNQRIMQDAIRRDQEQMARVQTAIDRMERRVQQGSGVDNRAMIEQLELRQQIEELARRIVASEDFVRRREAEIARLTEEYEVRIEAWRAARQRRDERLNSGGRAL